MTFCCNNIKKAYELINEVKKDIDRVKFNTTGIPFIYWSGEAFVDNVNNLVAIIKTNLNNATISINNCQCEAEKNFYKERQSELVDKLNNLGESSRAGYNELFENYEKLANNSINKESVEKIVKDLKDRYNELWNDYSQNIKDYNELFGNNKELVEKAKNLQEKYNKLVDDYNDKNSDYQDMKEKYEDANEKLYSEKLKHANEMGNEKLRQKDDNSILDKKILRLEERLERKSADLIRVSKELEDTKTELSLVRIAKDNQEIALIGKIDQKQLLLETVRQSLADLRVESEKEKGEKDIEINEKTSQLREKDNELKRKEEEIKKLRSQKGLSREELLTEKLRSEKGNLDLFASQLKINLEQIHSLSKYYERLFMARKNHNQANIDAHEENIARVKQEFSDQGINIINIREICQKCERIAEFCWELEQAQQQYQTHQEAPTN